jgi:hypothetical protein
MGDALLHPIKLLKQTVVRLDLLGERILSRKKVTEIMESAGFGIDNMTERNGITYFCAISKNRSVRLRRA